MRKDQVIRGYRVITKPSNANAGKCLWAFAEKDGKEYFIKEFLDPKIPRADAMGSVADKKRRYAECERFEQRHRQVMQLLNADWMHAGNLVPAVDFFAEETRYYKVTERVEHEDVEPHELPWNKQRLLLRTLADSLRLLHGCGIVHGDLKPENVLLHRPPQSTLLTAKLIDFDDAYPAGQPPSAETIGGDAVYCAPEWLRYVRGDAVALTQAADMFAFGLLLHTYLVGSPPDHGPDCDSAAAAVLTGAPLIWADDLGSEITDLLAALTDPDPAARPEITEVDEILTDLPEAKTPAPGRSRVRINIGGRPAPPPPMKPGKRLRINP
ncbi:protein kinase domain-containing protein [Kibdelosporangium aridum]|uniref:protein kinase domain-containing protein n=1 Tax=Kibdelosporangium aridum TaxID=2030 RepID=UPI0035F07703